MGLERGGGSIFEQAAPLDNGPHIKGHSGHLPPGPPELGRSVLRPVCGSVGPCSIRSCLGDASGKSGRDFWVHMRVRLLRRESSAGGWVGYPPIKWVGG